MNKSMNKVRYSTWTRRIISILEESGWKRATIDHRTYFVNTSIGCRFEYREYSRSSPVWICELEAIE